MPNDTGFKNFMVEFAVFTLQKHQVAKKEHIARVQRLEEEPWDYADEEF